LKDNETILLVEDDEIDVMTVKRALKQLEVKNPLHRAENGEAALAYLQDSSRALPGIIIMDVNMPRMNGIELLGVLKSDERFKKIPVIMLTTSKDDEDRIGSFNLSAAGYMIKPVDYDKFVRMMDAIRSYWTASELP
jgi:CheY-like chemotaxis protein